MGRILVLALLATGWLVGRSRAAIGGRFLGRTIGKLRLYRARVVDDNLRHAFPPAQRPHGPDVYGHLGSIIAQMVHLASIVDTTHVDPTSTSALASLKTHLASRREGVLVVSAHIGMWEALPGALSAHLPPATPLLVPYAAVSDPVLESVLLSLRRSGSPTTTFMATGGTLPRLAQDLAQGAVVGLMGDAFARPKESDPDPDPGESRRRVSFAGRTVGARRGIRALKTLVPNALVVVAAVVQNNEGVYHLTLQNVDHTLDDGLEPRIYAALDALIRNQPARHAYLWTHRLDNK